MSEIQRDSGLLRLSITTIGLCLLPAVLLYEAALDAAAVPLEGEFAAIYAERAPGQVSLRRMWFPRVPCRQRWNFNDDGLAWFACGVLLAIPWICWLALSRMAQSTNLATRLIQYMGLLLLFLLGAWLCHSTLASLLRPVLAAAAAVGWNGLDCFRPWLFAALFGPIVFGVLFQSPWWVYLLRRQASGTKLCLDSNVQRLHCAWVLAGILVCLYISPNILLVGLLLLGIFRMFAFLAKMAEYRPVRLSPGEVPARSGNPWFYP
jgi:hypothetical protein